MKSRILLAIVGVFFSLASLAQNIDSRSIIQRGIKLFDQQLLESAAEEFIRVPMTDTNYLWAQYELALTYSRDSTKREDAIRVIKNAKPIPFNSYELTLKMLEASIYDELKQTDKAHAVYDQILKKHPEYPQAYYEKGVVYFLSENFEKADEYFQQSLLRNPYHFRSHYFLGKSYFMQGRIAESIIATHFALMATGEKDQAGIAIDQLSLLSQGSDTLINRSKNKQAKFKNALYEEITEVLISKVAADKKYQLKTDIDDLITRQLQVVYELAKFNASDNGFVNQFYMPYVTRTWKEDNFNELMLYLFSEYGFKAIDKKAKKNRKRIVNLKEDLDEYFSKITRTRELDFGKRKDAKNIYLASGQDLIVCNNERKKIGKAEEIVFEGPFKYYSEGAMRSEGMYDSDNKKTGLWKYYNSMGVLVETETIEKGKLAGWETVYTFYGVPQSARFYDEGERVTKLKEYEAGVLSYEVAEVKKGEPLDFILYHPNGKVRAKYKMEGDEPIDGEVKYYYENLQLAAKLEYKKKKTVGTAERFFSNGAKKSIELYNNGELEGLCKYYYDNGQQKSEFTYSNDKMNGPFKSFYLNGNLEMEGNCKNGKYDGVIKNYYYDGRLLSTIDYKKGSVSSSKYEDPQLAKYKNTPNGVEYFFFGDGNVASKLNNNNKGILDGQSEYFFYNGKTREIINYNDGKKEGASPYFFLNGNKQADRKFKNDLHDGNYIVYEVNGDTSRQGVYVADEEEGVWKEYELGFAEQLITYKKGNLDGPSMFYRHEDKKLYKVKWYDKNYLIGYVEYDKNGDVTNATEFVGGNGQYITHHRNGADDFIGELKNGRFHGKGVKKYFDGNIEYTEDLKDGLAVTDKVEYYYNGNISDVYKYNAAGEMSVYEDYAVSGFLERKIVYTDTPNYYTAEYFIANKPYSFLQHREDAINGQEIYYGPNKEIAGVINYVADKVQSYSYLDKDGKYVDPISLNGGRGDVKMFYQNGQKSVEFTYKDGYVEGVTTYYYPNGQIGKQRTYQNQIITGKSVEYTQDGKLIYTANYNSKGNLEGAFKQFDASGTLFYYVTFKNGIQVGQGEMFNPKTNQLMKITFENNNIADAK